LTGRDYASQVFDMYQGETLYNKRDALIESVMEFDQIQIEAIRKLILEEDRLDILMRLLGYQAPPHQMMLNEFLMGRQYGLVLAPRGSGKSTSCDFLLCDYASNPES
jgi:hypothetical protein